MGSGKGKSRRVRADGFVPDAGDVRVLPSRWKDFLTEQALGNVSLGEYYEVEILPGLGGKVRALQSKVAAELLRDFIASGAITLPAGVDADDFEFDVCERDQIIPNKLSVRVPCLILRDKKTGAEEVCVMRPDNVIKSDTRMGEYGAAGMVDRIGVALRGIMNA